MPLPRWLARLNRHVTNPVLMRILGRRLPVIVHIGRTSGRTYRTPAAVFGRDEMYVPLTYGAATEWVHNVVAAGGCTIELRDGPVEAVDPRILDGAPAADALAQLPAIVRLGLKLLRTRTFLAIGPVSRP